MRSHWLCLVGVVLSACAPNGGRLSPEQRSAIGAELERAMRAAYDLSKPRVAERMLSLYPTTGRVISASGGRVLSSRDSLAAGIHYFWDNVGSNMKEPKWEWEHFYVDVLSSESAVVTATYRVPHRDPMNRPHVLGGAMTAVFEKRDGKWVIVQEHLSDTPTIPDSAQATMPTHDHH